MSPKYRSEIDGLRGIAILSVMLFHTGHPHFSGGYAGVDIFFVISGFLITSIIHDEIRSGNFSILDFYERRVRRIAPALLVVCVASLPFAWLWMLPTEFDDFGQSLATTMTFTSNFLFWQDSGYFEAAAASKPFLHTWSLAIEEQFYLLFPLLMLVLARFPARVTLLAIAGIALLSISITHWVSSIDAAANFYLAPTRIWELGSGCMVALLRPAIEAVSPARRNTAAIAGLAMVGVSFVPFVHSGTVPGVMTLLPVAGAALILGFASTTGMATRLLSQPQLVQVGLLSYSLYLWHHPIFAFAGMGILARPPVWLDAVLIAAAFPVAYVSWRWIERPFRRKGYFSRRTVFAATGIASTAIFAAGLAMHFGDGLPWRRANHVFASTLGDRMKHNTGLSQKCTGILPIPAECRTSEAPEILVWGDSYAMHIVEGVLASNPNAAILQATKSVCGPFFQIAPFDPPRFDAAWAKGCLMFNGEVERIVGASPSIKTVVLGSHFRRYLLPGSRVLREGGIVPSDLEFVRTELRQTLRWLKSRGIQPVIVAPPPRDGRDIGACITRAAWLDASAQPCRIRKGDWLEWDPQARSLIEDMRKEFNVLDVSDFICGETFCDVERDGVFLYRDNGHLSVEGSRYIGQHMDFFALLTGMERRSPEMK